METKPRTVSFCQPVASMISGSVAQSRESVRVTAPAAQDGFQRLQQPRHVRRLAATFSMCAAGLALLVIGLVAAKKDIAQARGMDKIVVLTHLCFAIPLAVFGAEHLSGIIPLNMVPSYVPWHLFWVYFVGFALIAASLSIATNIQVRWSGLLFGIMMFLFVAMLHFPGALSSGGRIAWTVVVRETSFGGGGLVLAGTAIGGRRGKNLITVGRMLIGIAGIVFGLEHFLHPLGLPGVPLQKQMPQWIPARALIDYLTGTFLIVAGVCFLTARKTRIAATCVGTWILLLVVIMCFTRGRQL